MSERACEELSSTVVTNFTLSTNSMHYMPYRFALQIFSQVRKTTRGQAFIYALSIILMLNLRSIYRYTPEAMFSTIILNTTVLLCIKMIVFGSMRMIRHLGYLTSTPITPSSGAWHGVELPPAQPVHT